MTKSKETTAKRYKASICKKLNQIYDLVGYGDLPPLVKSDIYASYASVQRTLEFFMASVLSAIDVLEEYDRSE